MLTNTLHRTRAGLTRIASRNRKALRDMPPGLYDYWARSAPTEFEGIPTDAFFYVRAADALLTFFACLKRHRLPCALPSKAADSVWHAWLRHDPAGLDAFCERHYEQRIPHVEAADMDGGMDLPLARSLVMARTLDRQCLAGPDVPRLFATDRKLRMPGGFGYVARHGAMVVSNLDGRGLPERETRVHPGTDPWFLFEAGLIGEDDLARWWSRYASRHATTTAGGDWGAAGGDSASCDSGGDGGEGGGGGSSCGGGCGGGGGD
ncbi:hypothetical protein [Pseudoduganella chitinolytica]|uniref:Uncharacterized protein n=1 Tax=Pseudoduganella chitinolytica TaxID=34070 RepID=A0ABY8B9J4_9BURK|nr:hypothetical protein [Pseudoduganella chitinolytica]WEF31029.1 hypothetical protein PX653_16295 [Pseudoduganella chitinolytica]